MRLALAMAAMAVATVSSAQEELQRPASYLVQSVGPVQVTLSAPQRVVSASVGGPAGWREVRDAWRDGVLTLSLTAEDLRAGRAMIVLDPPAWLDLSDDRPPAVLRLTVDGVAHEGESVALGWLDRAPERVVMEVRDERNPLDLTSVRARCGGRSYLPGEGGFSFSSDEPRHGVLEFLPGRLAAPGADGQTTLTLQVDDMALDRAATVRQITWALSPSITLEDGTIVTVDSTNPDEGWRDWSVIFDGDHMRDDETTTRDRTWLSQEHGDEHWLRFDFPQARQVRGITLWWAYYQGWRTSVAYDVQTWDGEKWVTQVQVREQTDTARSRHTFPPVTTTGLRVVQPPHSGHPGRRDHIWLSEVEVICR